MAGCRYRTLWTQLWDMRDPTGAGYTTWGHSVGQITLTCISMMRRCTTTPWLRPRLTCSHLMLSYLQAYGCQAMTSLDVLGFDGTPGKTYRRDLTRVLAQQTAVAQQPLQLSRQLQRIRIRSACACCPNRALLTCILLLLLRVALLSADMSHGPARSRDSGNDSGDDPISDGATDSEAGDSPDSERAASPPPQQQVQTKGRTRIPNAPLPRAPAASAAAEQAVAEAPAAATVSRMQLPVLPGCEAVSSSDMCLSAGLERGIRTLGYYSRKKSLPADISKATTLFWQHLRHMDGQQQVLTGQEFALIQCESRYAEAQFVRMLLQWQQQYLLNPDSSLGRSAASMQQQLHMTVSKGGEPMFFCAVHGFNESHDSMTCKELQRQIEEAEQRVLYHPAAYGKPGAAGRVQPTGDKRKGRGASGHVSKRGGGRGSAQGRSGGSAQPCACIPSSSSRLRQRTVPRCSSWGQWGMVWPTGLHLTGLPAATQWVWQPAWLGAATNSLQWGLELSSSSSSRWCSL